MEAMEHEVCPAATQVCHPVTSDIELTQLALFAEVLADASDSVIRPLFRCVNAMAKGDGTIPDVVTEADIEAERVLRSLIAERYPHHAIIGEEFGVSGSPETAEWCWVLDPIDGTAEFVTGTYHWGTLIGLCRYQVATLGVISNPVTCDRWVGAINGLTTWNGKPVHSSSCSTLNQARLNVSGYGLGSVANPDFVESCQGIIARAKTCSYSCNAFSWGLLASGHMDVVISSFDDSIYDVCAAIPVISGAGGHVLKLDGTVMGSGAKLLMDPNVPCGCFAVGDSALIDLVKDGLAKAAWLVK